MPKERILPYIILGLVRNTSPITGKEISRQFDNEIGEFWKASHSQIYPELRRMVEDDWLKQSTSSENAKEKYYQITRVGQEVLENWLLAPVQEPPLQRDFFSLKMFFVESKRDSRISSLLEEERLLLEQQLEHFQLRRQLLFSNQEAIDKAYGHYLILERAISRVENQLIWINDTIKAIAE